jgi:predicted esterase
MPESSPHQDQPVSIAGQPLDQAKAAMLLIHGRGATAASILALANDLYHADVAYLAPQAAGNSWYPLPFLAPIKQNEPGLSSGLAAIADTLARIAAAGIGPERVIIGGFSQGACLASEFVARNAQRYGGLLVFSGGLIGPPGTPREYPGSLDGTPVFIGCGDPDAHIPLERVRETAATFRALGGDVTERIYPNMGHTVIQDEIDHARRMVDAVTGLPLP